MEKVKRKKYSVPAIENTFKILSLLSRKHYSESTLTEIANALNLNTASCYRLLQQLEELSIVRFKQSNKRYTLGPYLIVLGDRAKENLDYISIVKPYLKEITHKTGLSSALITRVGADKLTILLKEEGENYGVSLAVGRHFSISDGAHGKCFLAHMEDKERIYYLNEQSGLRQLSQQDITILEEEFVSIRHNGYATTYGEYIKGVCGISAPIFNKNGEVEMVIAMFGLVAQLDKTNLDDLGVFLKQKVMEVTTKINGSVKAFN